MTETKLDRDLQGHTVRLDVKTLTDDGTFEGYGSVFNVMDHGKDIVKRGAFTECLKARGCQGIKMLYQHDTDKVMGMWTDIKEDNKGLYCKGKLAMTVSKVRDTYELMKMGAIDGLSIGYRAIDYSWDKEDSMLRYLKEVDVREVSVVTFPMNEAATVTNVKAHARDPETGALPSVRDFEQILRDEGFSAKEAKQIISAGYRSLLRDEAGGETGDSSNELVQLLATATRKLKQ